MTGMQKKQQQQMSRDTNYHNAFDQDTTIQDANTQYHHGIIKSRNLRGLDVFLIIWVAFPGAEGEQAQGQSYSSAQLTLGVYYKVKEGWADKQASQTIFEGHLQL